MYCFCYASALEQLMPIKQVTRVLCVSPAWPTLHSSEAVTANDAAPAASMPLQSDITQARVTPLTDALPYLGAIGSAAGCREKPSRNDNP